VRVLFVADVVGKPGRSLLRECLPALRRERAVDLVVANGENAAGGAGLTPVVARELLSAGVDVLTLGNHAWDKRELAPAIDEFPQLLRPLNYPAGVPGRGALVARAPGGARLAVLNAMGRVFSPLHLDCPFRAVERALEELGPSPGPVLLDFHAEATSEKVAMGWFLDGRVTAVIGTHTHVQTADATLLPKGTAYITDAGMTGPWVSSLGVDRDQVLERFLTQMPVRFEVAPGPRQFNGVLIEADDRTGRATGIEPLAWREPLAADPGGGLAPDSAPRR
jgi:metallophosphoesterase (TIGR00282 family)